VSASSLPRVIRFRTDLDNTSVAADERLLWPCHAFRVHVKAAPVRSVNIFERTVLRFADTGFRDTKVVAARCCLPLEFVELVFSKLVRVGFLDDRWALTADLDFLLKDGSRRVEERSGIAFIDLIGGSPLPVVLEGKPVFAEVVPVEGSRNRYRSLDGSGRDSWRVLSHHQSKYVNYRPSEIDIADSLHRQSTRPGPRGEGRAPLMNTARFIDSITIAEQPEMVFLSTKCVIQTGQHEPVLADPFGQGFSRLLTRHYQALADADGDERNCLQRILKRALNRGLGAEAADTAKPNTASRYPEVRSLLNEADRLERSSQEAQSSEGQKAARSDRFKCAMKLYSAVEHALQQVVSVFPAGTALQRQLIAQSHDNNAETLAALATRCGFAVREGGERILKVPGGRIERMLGDSQSELQPLLALALAGYDGVVGHPLRTVAAHDPQWLARLDRVKWLRDSSAHGEATDDVGDTWAVDILGVRQSIYRLLPDLEASDDGPAALVSETVANNIRLQARLIVEERLGRLGFQDASPDVKESLLAMELALAALPDEPHGDGLAVILSMAGAVQKAIHQAAKALDALNGPPGEVPLSRNKAEVLCNARRFGFRLDNDALPRALETVSLGRIKQSLQGMSTTLGTECIALMLRATPQQLSRIANRSPGLLLFVANLCDARGHGNAPVFLSRKSLNGLTGTAYDTVKLFMEI